MTKKGPLGTAEKFYIEQHCDEKEPELIAKELDRAISLVTKHSDHYRTMRTKSGGQMAKNRGSVAMTPNASMMGDDFKRENIPRANRKQVACTTTIRKSDRNDDNK